MPQTRSRVDDLTTGAFRETLDDPSTDLDPASVQRVLLCSGKIGHELIGRATSPGHPSRSCGSSSSTRGPRSSSSRILDRYPAAKQVWWVQEEPANMGAWNFVHGRLHRILRDRAELRHIARPTSPSPASGSLTVHEREQEQLLAGAFADLAERDLV